MKVARIKDPFKLNSCLGFSHLPSSYLLRALIEMKSGSCGFFAAAFWGPSDLIKKAWAFLV